MRRWKKPVTLSTALGTLVLANMVNKWLKKQSVRRSNYRYASEITLPSAMIGSGVLSGGMMAAIGGLKSGKKGALLAGITGLGFGSLLGALNFYKLQQQLANDPKMIEKIKRDDEKLQKRYNLILKKYEH